MHKHTHTHTINVSPNQPPATEELMYEMAASGNKHRKGKTRK